MVTTGHIVDARGKINDERDIEAWTQIVVDEDGLGAGVVDRLRQLDIELAGFRGGMPPIDPEHFVDRRSEMYWGPARDVRAGEVDIDPWMTS